MFSFVLQPVINIRLRDIDLLDYLDIAERCGKVHDDPAFFFSSTDGSALLWDTDEPLFLRAGDGKTVVAFYENLYVLMSRDERTGDKVAEICLKRPEDEWVLPVNGLGTGFDLLNPLNAKVEVYLKYSVSVIKIDRVLGHCSGDYYRSGVWNRSFYKSLNSFIEKVEGFTEINQIKVAYGR